MLFYIIFLQVTSTDSTMIFYVCLNMVVFHQSPTIYSQEIMWIVESNLQKLSVFYQHTKSNIQKTSSYCEEIMNVLASTESMVFMMNVSSSYTFFLILLQLDIKPTTLIYEITAWTIFTLYIIMFAFMSQKYSLWFCVYPILWFMIMG